MKAARFFHVAVLPVVFLFASAAFGQHFLGPAPVQPKDLKLAPGTNTPSPMSIPVTGGFSVNTDSREAVRDFYNGIFGASDNVTQNFDGDVPSCTPGANALAFDEAVGLRINWFRAMAGLPANTTLDPTYNTGNQAAAEIISANGFLSHNPTNTEICWSQLGHDFSGGSDLSGGSDGADAVKLFIWDFGNGNNEVGHRRWILNPPTTTFGTGDFPETINNGVTNIPGNAIYVFDPSINNPRPATRKSYVSWPPEGFVPYQVVYPYWSFALSNADVSAVSIAMKSNNVPISLVIEPQTNGFGENTVVWVPMGLDANCECTTFPFNGTDTIYSVTISNILTVTAGVTNKTSVSYNVTVIDPAVSGTDTILPTIHGPSPAAVGTSNIFSVTAINDTNVNTYQWIVGTLTNGNLFDNANNALVNFTFTPATDYPVVTGSPDGNGNCFHLCDDNNSPQIMQLIEELVPSNSTTISFDSYLGFSTTDETSRVQVSTNGGSVWIDLFDQPGCDSQCAPNFAHNSLSLSNFAGQTTLLRFNYDLVPGGQYYPGTGQSSTAFGWSVKNILITNTLQLINVTTNLAATTNLVSTTFTDNANNGLTNFTFTPSPNYPPTTTAPDGSGSNCFHLCDDNATAQLLQLDQTLLPSASSTLSFGSCLGFSTSDETAHVQVSTNNGATWTDLFAEVGCDNGQCENTFTPHTLSLSSCAGMHTLLRFAYTLGGGGSFFPNQSGNFIGWCVNNITVSNSQRFVVTVNNTTNFTIVPTAPGGYLLQAIPILFNQYPLAIGPIFQVAVASGSGITMNQPAISGTNVQLNFAVTGGLSGTFKLLQANTVNGSWTTNSAAKLTTNVAGSSFRFTTTNGPAMRFYRIQLTPGS